VAYTRDGIGGRLEGWGYGYLVVLWPPNKDTEGAKRHWRCKIDKKYKRYWNIDFFEHYLESEFF
jgi:hypothetical protein